MTPFVSIIIPVKEVNDYIRESMAHIQALDYKDFEVIIFPDSPSDDSFPKTRIIPTGPVGPAEKRDQARLYARGEIFAFLDDDAYPRKDWLQKAVRHFNDQNVAAVGGPAVTPEHDSVWQRASGRVFSSWLASGNYGYRYMPEKEREVDDFPTVNLIIRRSAFEEAGGFDTAYWPGEDTKLCLDLTKKLGKKIIYDPRVFVFHHRRPLFLEHLKQVGRYAFHRGYFAKVLPETSMRLPYFIPSLFVLWLLLGGPISIVSGPFMIFYLGVLSIYFMLLISESVLITLKERDPLVGALSMPGIFFTHLIYGLRFMQGISSKGAKR
ncbi:MAG TPA: glycosyl transferase [Deltaproteobacteria bacterium]|nr:MAG: hypothetical protein A2Z79_08350 [Deltaproteobacteria bacterium GWA2_55_82]OGQ63131.1 MAG: hypothetical protein A3I81_09980 [Deltaproteobacteria bacterium RIFCSPLOWO2_02_FULL_55_12]OIJ73596.1 MAG: hypothetical protein A2V21_304545 [Deltaproteobacteria bacterium GWC2_55_46]HBG47731.1 glycosyl transferase [Deltaproteobacteria bacterium]HCY12047.1 glycosyl transferase [Deltaproteobacteria bacterium]